MKGKRILQRFLLGVVVLAMMSFFTPLPNVHAITIDFSTGLLGEGGLITFVSGLATGTNIPMGAVTVSDGASAPYVANAVLNFDTGVSSNFIQIVGNIPGLNIEDKVLLSGSFSSSSVSQTNGSVFGSGVDEKGPELLDALGIDPTTEWEFFAFTLTTNPGLAESAVISTDIRNTTVPEPTTLLLLGLGLIGLAAGVRRKK